MFLLFQAPVAKHISFSVSVLNGGFLAAQHQAGFRGSTYLLRFLSTWHQDISNSVCYGGGLLTLHMPSPKVISIYVYVPDVGGSFTW